jgi:hypothetical protein
MSVWHDPADIVPAFGSLVRMNLPGPADDHSIGMIVDTTDTEWTFRKLSRDERSLNKRRSIIRTRNIAAWRFLSDFEHKLGDES